MPGPLAAQVLYVSNQPIPESLGCCKQAWTVSFAEELKMELNMIWPEVPEILVESMFTDLASRSGTSAHFSNYVGRKVIDDTNEDGWACFEHLCYHEAEMIDLQKQPAFQSP